MIEGLVEMTDIHPYWLGVYPRTLAGLPGIFFSPLIHAGIDHLLSNTLPLIVVGSGTIYFYRSIAYRVIGLIWLFSGFWTWLAARGSYHIGASGLIYGLVCFLFFSGIIRKDTRLMAVSLLVTFLYGSMVWGILPIDQSVSWEAHLFGSIAGIICAFYYRQWGPQRPKTQWEIEEEQEKLDEMNAAGSDSQTAHQSFTINYDFIPEKGEEKKKDADEKSE